MDVKHDSLDAMWGFLQMGGQKTDIPTLKEYCERLQKMLTQKTAGQREAKKSDISFAELDTVCNIIVIEAMAMYLPGDLDRLEWAVLAVEAVVVAAALVLVAVWGIASLCAWIGEIIRCALFHEKTHGDEIRGMADEALAKLFSSKICPPKKKCQGAECFGCWLHYLRSPVDGEDT